MSDSTPDLAAVVRSFASVPGGLLPALHAVQRSVGHVPRSLIPELARTFGLGEAEVHGVLTFYHDFRTGPLAGPDVQVCRGEACQARGGRATWEAALDAADGQDVEVREVFCLGLCAQGPTVAVDGRLHVGVDAADAVGIVGHAVRQRAVPPRQDPPTPGDVVVYVPRDAAALAVGADDVATMIEADERATVVRTGSRGMLWLEPMVEVATPRGRIAYGPVTTRDVPRLLATGMLDGADHALCLGPVEELDWLRRQRRVTFARVGVVDPRDAADYEAHGGLAGLRRALALAPADVVAEVTAFAVGAVLPSPPA